MPADNDAACCKTFLTRGFVDVLFYLQVRDCRVIRKPFEKILVRRSTHVGILVASIGVIPSLEAILTFPPTLAPDRDLCEKGKLHTIQMSNF